MEFWPNYHDIQYVYHYTQCIIFYFILLLYRILKLLYKRGADFSVQNEDKCTPLDVAVKNDHKECTTFLKNPDAVVKKVSCFMFTSNYVYVSNYL